MFEISTLLSLPLLVLLPLIFGIYILTPLCSNNEVFIRRFAKTFTIFHFCYSCLFLMFYNKGYSSLCQLSWIGNLGVKFGFVMDELSLLMTILTTLIFTLAVIASKSQIRTGYKWYYALLLIFETTILAIFNSGDAFTFFLLTILVSIDLS